MLTLKYPTEESLYPITFKKLNSTTIQLTGDFPVRDVGFQIYKDHLLLGDYTAYRTIYRTLKNGAQFSCNGTAAPALPPSSPPDTDNQHS